MNFLDSMSTNSPIFYILVIWSLFWKGIALWRSSRLEQRNWFICMFILNTLGILEIAYLFYFSKKRLTLQELNPLQLIEGKRH